jgi:hypothetical protein
MVWAWTVAPLAVFHGWAWRRSRDLLRFQLVLDLLLAAVVGPALVVGGDLNPVRCLSRNRPFHSWVWSENTRFQPTHSDLVLQLHPWMEETRRLTAGGGLPLISDRIGGGLPLLANGQTGLWAPVNLPVWTLGVERGSTVMAFWKLQLAGLGAFLLLRRGWRLGWIPAAVGATAFSGGAYLMAWLVVPMGWVIAALPWTWWMTTLALRGRFRVSRTVGAGVGFGWLLGSGLNPETTAIVVGSALLGGAILHPGRWRRLVLIVVVSAPVMLALAWPTLAYIGASHKYAALRDERPNLERPPMALRMAAVRQLIVPLTHGHPARGDWSAPYPHSAVAAGVGGAVLGVLAVGRPRRRRRRVVWAAVANLALAAVVVYRLPPLDAVLVRIPPIDTMTLPRFAVLLTWGLALLAALAVEGALTGGRWRSLWRGAAVAVVGVAALAGRPWNLAAIDLAMVVLTVAAFLAAGFLLDRPRWLVPVMTAELALYAVGINPVADPSDRLPRPPLVDRLVALSSSDGGRVLGLGGVLPANLAARYGLSDLRAYDPLRPRPYVRMMTAMGDDNPGLGGPLRKAPRGLCGAWSVRYLATPPGVEPDGWEQVWSDSSGSIWENPEWLPEVRVAARTVAAGELEGWRLMIEDGIDFATTAVVPHGSEAAAAESVRLSEIETGRSRIRAEVSCDGPCLLVTARPWAPGWGASVGGRPAEVVRANLAGLGVHVQAGDHVVELVYNPWRW